MDWITLSIFIVGISLIFLIAYWIGWVIYTQGSPLSASEFRQMCENSWPGRHTEIPLTRQPSYY